MADNLLITFEDLCAELLSRLQVADNSTLYTSQRCKDLIQQANQWATSQYLFPALERAKTTHTEAGQYYYDYPDEFRTDAITRVYVDGKFYDSIAFDDFLTKREEVGYTDKVFADYGRQWFIHPIPTVTGTNNVDIWGCINAPALITSGKTIFSDSDATGNEAIVKKGLSVAVAKKNKNLAVQEENEARSMLGTIYSKILTRSQKDKRKDHP